MKGNAKRYYEFDGFRLDPSERTFFRQGQAVPLTPKVFDVLVMLVEKNHHTITKNEFLENVWEGSIVEDNSLNRNISILRRALGAAENSGYIKTVPKTGYRFEADVRCIVEDEEELIVEKRTNYNLSFRSEASALPTYLQKRLLKVSAALAGLVVIASAVAWFFWSQSESAAFRKAEAFGLYQRGRNLWQNRSADGLHEATLLLENAIAKEPDFALAHSALADAYAFDARNWRKAESAAVEAIRLDPSLGEPYATLGFVRLFWQWNPADAEVNFKRAISLNPDYATAHQWYGLMLASVGHFNEALKELQYALQLQPNSAAINTDLCQALYFVGRNFEAEAHCKRALDLDPNFFAAHSNLYLLYSAMGKEREAVEAYFIRERLAVNASSLPADFEQLRTAFDRGGIQGFWREYVRLRKRIDGDCGNSVAWAHASLGEKSEAVECLMKAKEKREFDLVFIYADPVFRTLRDKAEYRDLADRMMTSKLKDVSMVQSKNN